MAMIAADSHAQPPTSRRAALPAAFQIRSLDTGETVPREYVVFVPEQYDAARQWPLIVFLHGSGECGLNDHRSATVGLGAYVRARRLHDFPALVLIPQVTQRWFRGPNEQWIWRMLGQVTREFNVDRQRVYLTGLSMGGFGTWEMAMRRPDVWAAIVPICGGSETPELIGNLRGLPIWAFHGAKDDRVPVENTRRLIEALRSDGQEPKYTEYPEGNHFCWDRAYATPGLFDWLFQQRRRERPQQFTYRLPAADIVLPWRVWWFQFDRLEKDAIEAGVSARVDNGDTILLATAGIRQATVRADALPVNSGTEVSISWNGRTRRIGPLQGDIRLGRRRDQPPQPPPSSAPSTP